MHGVLCIKTGSHHVAELGLHRPLPRIAECDLDKRKQKNEQQHSGLTGPRQRQNLFPPCARTNCPVKLKTRDQCIVVSRPIDPLLYPFNSRLATITATFDDFKNCNSARPTV